MLDIAPCQCASVSVESIDLTCHIQDVMIWNAQGPAFQLKPCLLPWCQVSIFACQTLHSDVCIFSAFHCLTMVAVLFEQFGPTVLQ